MKNKIKQIFNIVKDKFLEGIKFSGIAFVISFFGAIGGSENATKDWRRYGVPVTFFLCGLWALKFNPLAFVILLQHLPFRLGHGIPDKTDEGSFLGRFFYKIFKGNETLANTFTRGTIATLLCVPFVAVPVLKGNWVEFILCSVGVILTFALLAWRNLGVYIFKIKDVSYYCCRVDVICFGVLGMAGLKIIF